MAHLGRSRGAPACAHRHCHEERCRLLCGRPRTLRPRHTTAAASATAATPATSGGEGPRCITSTVRGGVLKLSRDGLEAHCGIVPLLDARTSELPLAASLEFVCPCSSAARSQATHAHTAHAAQGTRDVVELVYVLSGQGHLVEAHTGITWPVQPGVSAVTWAQSTYLQPAAPPHDAAANPDAPTAAEPLAVLKFYLPTSLLTSHHPSTVLEPQQRQVLVAASTPSSPSGQPLQRAVLEDAQAVRLLKAAHARAWHGPQPSSQPAVLSNIDSNTSSGSAGSSEHHARGARPHKGLRALPPLLSHMLHTGLRAVGQSLQAHTSQAGTALHHLLSSYASRGSRSSIWQAPYTTQLQLPGGSSLPNMQHTAPGKTRPGKPPRSTAHASTSTPVAHGITHVSHGSTPVSHGSTAHQAEALPVPRMHATGSGALVDASAVLVARTMEDFKTFQMPKQTNQLAFVFDPLELGLSLSFGVEIFEPGHHTPLHVHQTGHELFFVLSGEGDAYCDGHHIPVRAGDCIVFPPGTLHGLDNNAQHKLYAIQLMCPDDEFVGYVQSGTRVQLRDEDLCAMTARSC